MTENFKQGKEENPTRRELLWRQYNLQTDLYKYYLDLIFKANAFFYFITGGIVSYFFANTNAPYIKFSLLLPIMLSISLGIIFIYGSRLMEVSRKDIIKIINEINLETAPEFRVLSFSLQISGIIFFTVGIALIGIVIIR